MGGSLGRRLRVPGGRARDGNRPGRRARPVLPPFRQLAPGPSRVDTEPGAAGPAAGDHERPARRQSMTTSAGEGTGGYGTSGGQRTYGHDGTAPQDQAAGGWGANWGSPAPSSGPEGTGYEVPAELGTGYRVPAGRGTGYG